MPLLWMTAFGWGGIRVGRMAEIFTYGTKGIGIFKSQRGKVVSQFQMELVRVKKK